MTHSSTAVSACYGGRSVRSTSVRLVDDQMTTLTGESTPLSL
jgi:hypothetical protein